MRVLAGDFNVLDDRDREELSELEKDVDRTLRRCYTGSTVHVFVPTYWEKKIAGNV